MGLTQEQQEVIRNCQSSITWFLSKCSRCRSKECVPGKKQCERCLLRLTERRARNQANSLCSNCGRSLAPSSSSKCVECLERSREWRHETFLEVLSAYGGPKCVGCAESIVGFLTLDHINNDGGGRHRTSGNGFYSRLKQTGYPAGLQVLCYNCNIGKSRNAGICVNQHTIFYCGCSGSGVCVHGFSRYIRARRRDYLVSMDEYGSQCSCCGSTNPFFLTLDHGNDDGAAHRLEMGREKSIAVWVRRNGYPKDIGLRVQCSNCNCGRARCGGICPHISGVTSAAR